MEKVTVGIAGSGFVAEIHGKAYEKVHGIDAMVKAVAATGSNMPRTEAFMKRFGVEVFYDDFDKLLKDPELDVIDICTPVYLHAEMVIKALEAGKHVICEKPLTGYCGGGGEEEPIGKNIPKAKMYERVLATVRRIGEAVEGSGKLFMYAEDWVYAPAVQKTTEILKKAGSHILFLKGEESHGGSHAPHAAKWSMTGGGALIRQGCHPLSALLYLKRIEHENTKVKSVVADVGVLTESLPFQKRRFIEANPMDVEDWAIASLTFDDETKGLVMAGDVILGGVRNLVEIYCDDGVVLCNMAPNNAMLTYYPDPDSLKDVYITEKVETKCGWQSVYLEEEIMRGYVGEIQDFMECIVTGRKPLSDYKLAAETIKATYAAYTSAEEGRRVELSE